LSRYRTVVSASGVPLTLCIYSEMHTDIIPKRGKR